VVFLVSFLGINSKSSPSFQFNTFYLPNPFLSESSRLSPLAPPCGVLKGGHLEQWPCHPPRGLLRTNPPSPVQSLTPPSFPSSSPRRFFPPISPLDSFPPGLALKEKTVPHRVPLLPLRFFVLIALCASGLIQGCWFAMWFLPSFF